MFEIVDGAPQEAVIKVVGVGGCGGNAVDHMIAAGVQGVEFIVANTDSQALKRNQAQTQMQLGLRSPRDSARAPIPTSASSRRSRIATVSPS